MPGHTPKCADFWWCPSHCPSYLTLKIQEGSVQGIMCPAVDCPQLVPVDVIEQLVSPEMVRRYLQFDIEVGASPFLFVEGRNRLSGSACSAACCTGVVVTSKRRDPIGSIQRIMGGLQGS